MIQVDRQRENRGAQASERKMPALTTLHPHRRNWALLPSSPSACFCPLRPAVRI